MLPGVHFMPGEFISPSWVCENVSREDRLWLKKLSAEVERHHAIRRGLVRTGGLKEDGSLTTPIPQFFFRA